MNLKIYIIEDDIGKAEQLIHNVNKMKIGIKNAIDNCDSVFVCWLSPKSWEGEGKITDKGKQVDYIIDEGLFAKFLDVCESESSLFLLDLSLTENERDLINIRVNPESFVAETAYKIYRRITDRNKENKFIVVSTIRNAISNWEKVLFFSVKTINSGNITAIEPDILSYEGYDEASFVKQVKELWK